MPILPVTRDTRATRSRRNQTPQPSAADVETVSSRVSRDLGLSAPADAFRTTTGIVTGEAAPALDELARQEALRQEKLKVVAQKQQNREDVVAKARAKRKFRQEMGDEFNRIETSEDPSDINVLKAYGAFSEQKKQEAFQNSSLSPDALADLTVSIEDAEAEFIGKASGAAVAAGKAIVDDQRAADLNPLLTAASQDPSAENISQLILKSGDVEREYDGQFTEKEQINNRKASTEDIALSGVNTLFSEGKFAGVEELIANPTITSALSPKTLISINDRVGKARVEERKEIEKRARTAQSTIGKIRADERDGKISPEDAEAAIQKATFIARKDLNEPGKIVPATDLNPNLPEDFNDVFFIQQPSGSLTIIKGENGEGGKVDFFRQELDDGTVGVFQQVDDGAPEFVKLLEGADGEPIRTGVSQRGEAVGERAEVTAKLRERGLEATESRLEQTITQNARTSEATLRDDFEKRAEPFREQARSLDQLEVALSGDISGLDNKIITNLVSRAIAPTNVRAQAELDAFKGFGDISERLSGAVSTFFTGVRTEAQLDQVRTILAEMREKHISPAMDELGKGFSGVAIRSGLDPDNVVVTGTKQVKTLEEAMELPQGTVFIDPDGVRRVR